MKKVYCKNCRYFKLRYKKFRGYEEYCDAPENIDLKGGYYSIHVIRHLGPKIINSDNGCKHYRRKWWKFWVKEEKRKIFKGYQPKTDTGPKPDPKLISYVTKRRKK